jgi:alpha-1,3-fucosyltransferase
MMLIFLLINVVFAVFLYQKQNLNSSLEQLYMSLDKSVIENLFPSLFLPKRKTILIWNSAHRIETAAFGIGHEPFVQHGCEISDCILFDNATSPDLLPIEDYDAIILHMHELWITGHPIYNRQKYQRLIFLTQEAPTTLAIDVNEMGNYFNWTMSYRFNSDIQLLYGRIHPGPTAPKTREETDQMVKGTTVKNYAANKTQQIAWMVSHCDTHGLRETYVAQLSKFIPVDIYGGCGNLTCDRNESHWLSEPICYTMLEKKYKFYLSFENCICTDYVTEKFFELLNYDIIPIVYGGANYSQLAPLHSYINALDFTPETLAQYLKILDANDTLYNEYFWWKDHYRIESGVEQMARHGFCDLCKKLHQDDGVTKYYPELLTDWNPDTVCKQIESWDIPTYPVTRQFLKR